MKLKAWATFALSYFDCVMSLTGISTDNRIQRDSEMGFLGFEYY